MDRLRFVILPMVPSLQSGLTGSLVVLKFNVRRCANGTQAAGTDLQLYRSSGDVACSIRQHAEEPQCAGIEASSQATHIELVLDRASLPTLKSRFQDNIRRPSCECWGMERYNDDEKTRIPRDKRTADAR